MKDWRKYLEYDVSSPSCLRWKVDRKRIKAGDVAGCLTENGYWRVHLFGKMYRVHRLLLDAPVGVEVDHRNGDRSDNRLSNLRLVTKVKNQRNKRKHSNNTSGICGVSIYEDGRGTGNIRAVAKWFSNGKKVSRSFSFNVYGKTEAIRLAINARKEGISAETDYTDRHGT